MAIQYMTQDEIETRIATIGKEMSSYGFGYISDGDDEYSELKEEHNDLTDNLNARKALVDGVEQAIITEVDNFDTADLSELLTWLIDIPNARAVLLEYYNNK